MRRLLGWLLVAGLVGAGPVLAAGATTDTWLVADNFSSGGYGGSNGTHPWLHGWEEHGESDGAGAGIVQVVSDDACYSSPCLRIASLAQLASAGASRCIDVTGAVDAELGYKINFVGAAGTLVVDYSVNHGGSWTKLKTHRPGDSGWVTHKLSLSTDELMIRWRSVDLAIASLVTIDKVEVRLKPDTPTTIPSTTTSTTTTVPPTTSTTVRPSTTTTRPEPAPTSTTRPSTTTTSTSRPEPDVSTTTTSTSRPDETTTTTTVPDEAAVGGGTPPAQPPGGSGATTVPPAPSSLLAASPTFGVVTRLDPGLAPRGLDVNAVEGFVVRYLLSAESINLDVILSLAIGAILARASLRKLDGPELPA